MAATVVIILMVILVVPGNDAPMAKLIPPKGRDHIRGELASLTRQMSLACAIRERFPPRRLMDAAEQLLDAEKMFVSREAGNVFVPDNVARLGVLKLLCEHYDLPETRTDQSPGTEADDIFRSPSVLAAAKKLIEQQEREIERLQTQAPPPTENE